MGKKRASLPIRQLLVLRSKPVFSIFLVFCVFAFVRLNRSKSRSSTTDKSSIDEKSKLETNPKVAFLFLARRNVPLDFMWGAFFQEANVRNFSIYIHSEPGFVFNESTSTSPFFYGRQLNDSIKVAWGDSSMIEAERLLLKVALGDPANQRFVLLSDSCLPLYKFRDIYEHLISSPKSYIESYFDFEDDRYDPKLLHAIPKDRWRKGSQRQSNASVSARRQMLDLHKPQDCIPDEHYLQTLLAMSGFENEFFRRSLTYAQWNQSATEKDKQWHPFTFDYTDASPQSIREIKEIEAIHYESENWTEWCQVNGAFAPCYLFARKFTRGAAVRLLSEGLLGPFDPVLFLNATRRFFPVKHRDIQAR
ncbi:glycosyltransferase BC10-like isoform X2 [Rhodamnia argentea]|uniref:Glycosyltransferase BC10-like isoform X2 n=1 Tax=Rhodamnia argentea TaxID=178133 RepID=A0ABM3HNI5_9MYRT|nr:glycosyltransferase BC10-like isoform X2 [Rhodamnia argentea]